MIQVNTKSVQPILVKTFPKIMKSDRGMIVLFQKEREGTIIVTEPSAFMEYRVGEYRTDFIMDCFSEYNESITLQNI